MAGYYFDGDDTMAMYMNQRHGMGRGGPPKRFDEYYRCYPMVMLPGPEREDLNYGGKIIMPPSALEKLTRLHITYPMLFELHNGQTGITTHCGVLEFIAEEGKLFMPPWMMQTLLIETGDIIQIKSTDLAPGSFVKLQPQSSDFLDISNPKAVLEKAFRSFSTVTVGDIFSFRYNDTQYDVAVLDVKPTSDKQGISVLETDLSVDFAPPVGYVEPERQPRGSGTSTPRSVGGLPAGGVLHSAGTMAQSINYDQIAPSSTSALAGAKAISSNFLLGGQKLNAKKNSKAPTPKASTPVAGNSTNTPAPKTTRRNNGPQPLRLAPNKLFFGYEIKPVKTDADRERERSEAQQPRFEGTGMTLKGKKVEPGLGNAEVKVEKPEEKETGVGRRLDGKKV